MSESAPATESGRSRFDGFAEAVTQLVSRGVFFAVSLIVVLVWLPSVVLFENVDTWQLVINTATSVLAFLLVALLQNSEQRNDRALHRKLDVLAAGIADLIEHDLDTASATVGQRVEQLRGVVRLEDQL